VDFPSYPFIIAYPFIREVRVLKKMGIHFRKKITPIVLLCCTYLVLHPNLKFQPLHLDDGIKSQWMILMQKDAFFFT
jgi:hypothetical protein